MTASNQHARVKVKICGITRPEDARLAAQLGADAIGLVFYPDSPRAVTIADARAIVEQLPPFICKTGLFVNAAEDWIRSVLDAVSLDLLQFHGEEQPAHCERYSKPYTKAVRMQATMDLTQIASEYQSASALLLDSYVKGTPGGTGQTFDWSLIPEQINKPVILAGGLTAENVAAAIHQVRPYAVDVSGGVEAEQGIKDPGKLAEFINEARNA